MKFQKSLVCLKAAFGMNHQAKEIKHSEFTQMLEGTACLKLMSLQMTLKAIHNYTRFLAVL